MALKVYVDRMSQPSRAILIFCKVNGIEFEEIEVSIMKGEHRKPEYKEINPLGFLPAIAHGDFKLIESHAILSYLACAFPEVRDHWYPADLMKRAKVNSVLDWHHTNLRSGAAPFIRLTVFGPLFGLPLNPAAAVEAEKILTASLVKLESFWLKEDGKFLLGASEPSIADLILVSEIMEMEVLDEKECTRILSPFKKVLQWIEDTRIATNPHFDEIHGVLLQAKASFIKQPTAGSTIRAMLSSNA